MIAFNDPPYTAAGVRYMMDAIKRKHICGDGYYTKKCSSWIRNFTGSPGVLLTTSCTHALEMAANLISIQPGDEVIMPSYTFASTADAFVLRGAKIVFIDIHPETMNMDETLIEPAITEKTKAIVPVHYAGVSCKMDEILALAGKYHLYVIEDAAQGLMSRYQEKALGAIGDFGCYSFHETKNYSMGEGGALLIKDASLIEKAEILREKGTNRSKFWRGEIDKYTWVDYGSSYLPSELNAAYLWGQLEQAEAVNQKRLDTWDYYNNSLCKLKEAGYLSLPYIPKGCIRNAHMYYIKTATSSERDKLLAFLRENGVHAVFHYIPLHKVPAGIKYGVFYGEDKYTTAESEKIIRLPMHCNLKESDLEKIVQCIYKFYQ